MMDSLSTEYEYKNLVSFKMQVNKDSPCVRRCLCAPYNNYVADDSDIKVGSHSQKASAQILSNICPQKVDTKVMSYQLTPIKL